MTKRTLWLAKLLLVAFFLAPEAAVAQPLGQGSLTPWFEHPLPLNGSKSDGFFAAVEAIYWHVSNPLERQVIARRELYDFAGDFFNDFSTGPGDILGSQAVALTADMAGGDEFEAGFRSTVGYRFTGGLEVELCYWTLPVFSHTAQAGIIPHNLNVGFGFVDSFLSARFFNFPTEFAGPDNDVLRQIRVPLSDPPVYTPGPAIPAFGIFNGAELFTIKYEQEFWNLELNFRLPIEQNDSTRSYMIVGPRIMNTFENFELRIVDLDIDGEGSPLNTARYNTRTRNILFGAQCGYGSELYLKGGFALSGEVRVGCFFDVFRGKANLEREDGPNAPNVRNDVEDHGISPFFQGGLFLWYYPVDGVVLRFGYEYTGLINVWRSPNPIDFNVGSMSPDYKQMFIQLDGMSGGIALIF
jgi:hypothetical protein